MPPTKPQSNPRKKPAKKIKILQLKRSEQKSLLAEYFYPILGGVFVVATLVGTAFGLSLGEAAIVGLWIAAIAFFSRQVVRFLKNEPAVRKPAKKQAAASTEKKYVPPALPRVSKDFSPMPPAGDKRYPPPSPFIKPPK